MNGRFTSPDEFKGGPDELFDFEADASDNPTFYADLENPQSLNKYQYGYNNPYKFNDPSGHCPPCGLIMPGNKAVPAAGEIVTAISDLWKRTQDGARQTAREVGDALVKAMEGSAKGSEANPCAPYGFCNPIRLENRGANPSQNSSSQPNNATAKASVSGSAGGGGKNRNQTTKKTTSSSKVQKSTTTRSVGGTYTKKTVVRPGKGPGQSRAEYVTVKTKDGRTIRTYKDSYDRGNKFQGRKPLRGGPEGRPQE